MGVASEEPAADTAGDTGDDWLGEEPDVQARDVYKRQSLPCSNTSRVGMLITPNWPASSGCSSTFTLPTFTSVRSSATSSTTGLSIRQGPHQLAQKLSLIHI